MKIETNKPKYSSKKTKKTKQKLKNTNKKDHLTTPDQKVSQMFDQVNIEQFDELNCAKSKDTKLMASGRSNKDSEGKNPKVFK